MPDNFGLHLLMNPVEEADPIIDIVFIHGLSGGSLTTWAADRNSCTDTSPNWIRDFLPQSVPSARVFTFGYERSLPTFWALISNHAESLLSALTQERNFKASVSSMLCHCRVEQQWSSCWLSLAIEHQKERHV
jgi:hypothetical protein